MVLKRTRSFVRHLVKHPVCVGDLPGFGVHDGECRGDVGLRGCSGPRPAEHPSPWPWMKTKYVRMFLLHHRRRKALNQMLWLWLTGSLLMAVIFFKLARKLKRASSSW